MVKNTRNTKISDRSLRRFLPRLDRMIRGSFTEQDILEMFQMLRATAKENSITRDIGDFLAHPEGRDRGRTLSMIRRTVESAEWGARLLREGGVKKLDVDWRRAIKRTSDSITDDLANSVFGISKNDFESTLSNILSKLEFKGGVYVRRRNSTFSKYEQNFIGMCNGCQVFPIAMELDDVMSELQNHLENSGLLKSEDSAAFLSTRQAIGLFIAAKLNGTSMTASGVNYILSAKLVDPSTRLRGDNHPSYDGAVVIIAISDRLLTSEDILGSESTVFCVYGSPNTLCEQKLLDIDDWSKLTLELSDRNRLTYIDQGG